MNEHDRRILWHLRQRARHRLAPRCTARHARAHLAAAEFLGEQDRGLLPAGRSGDNDEVPPVRIVQTLQALGKQRLVTEPRECFRTIGTEPVPATRCSEDCPNAHLEEARAFVFGLAFAAGLAAVLRAAGFAEVLDATLAGFAAVVVFLRPL